MPFDPNHRPIGQLAVGEGVETGPGPPMAQELHVGPEPAHGLRSFRPDRVGNVGRLTGVGAGVQETETPTARQAAFDRYVLPELDVLYRVALSITRHRADAEDLVQETLLRAYRAAGRFDGRHPRAWLLTIMRNAQINRVRRRRPELLRDGDESERLADLDESGDSPEGLVVDAVFDAAVERALEALPPRFREIVELVDLHGLAYQEAADALGIPVGTVMSRLHRARSRIRRALADEGITARSDLP